MYGRVFAWAVHDPGETNATALESSRHARGTIVFKQAKAEIVPMTADATDKLLNEPVLHMPAAAY